MERERVFEDKDLKISGFALDLGDVSINDKKAKADKLLEITGNLQNILDTEEEKKLAGEIKELTSEAKEEIEEVKKLTQQIAQKATEKNTQTNPDEEEFEGVFNEEEVIKKAVEEAEAALKKFESDDDYYEKLKFLSFLNFAKEIEYLDDSDYENVKKSNYNLEEMANTAEKTVMFTGLEEQFNKICDTVEKRMEAENQKADVEIKELLEKIEQKLERIDSLLSEAIEKMDKLQNIVAQRLGIKTVEEPNIIHKKDKEKAVKKEQKNNSEIKPQ